MEHENNHRIAQLFRQMAALLDEKNVAFKPAAYRRAAHVLEDMPEDVSQIADKKKLMEFPGIGDAMASKILEYLETGKIAHVDNLRAEQGGIPPELIGSGRGIKMAKEKGLNKLVEKTYINFKLDMKKAGGFLYKPGLIALAKKSPAWRGVWEDVQEIENYLLMELGPRTREQKAHYKLCEQLHKQLKTKKSLTSIIEKQALLRHSMG